METLQLAAVCPGLGDRYAVSGASHCAQVCEKAVDERTALMHAATATGVEWSAVRDSRLLHCGRDAHGADTYHALLDLKHGATQGQIAVVIKRLAVLRRTALGWPEVVPWPEWAFHVSSAAAHQTGALRPRRCLDVATVSPGQVALFLEDTSADGNQWNSEAIFILSRELAIWSATLGVHGRQTTPWLDPDAFGRFHGRVMLDDLDDVVPSRLMAHVHVAVQSVQANLACVRSMPTIVGPTAVSLDNVRGAPKAGRAPLVVGDWQHFGVARVGCLPAALVASAIVRTDLAASVLGQCENAALCGYEEGLKESGHCVGLDEILVGYRAASSLRLVRRAAHLAHLRRAATGGHDEMACLETKAVRFLTALGHQWS
jgi:hypothetical protein